MSKKQAVRKLVSQVNRKGREQLVNDVTKKVNYNVSFRDSYVIAGKTVKVTPKEDKGDGFRIAMDDAIEAVRRELATKEKDTQTFAKMVRRRLKEDGRYYSGRLDRSIFSSILTQVNRAQASEAYKALPQPTTDGKGLSLDQIAIKKNDIKRRQSIYSEMRKKFGKKKRDYELGVEVSLRALEYYRMLDVGFSPEEADKYLPYTSKENDRLRDWVKKKINPSGNVNTLYLIANRIKQKWAETGYRGKYYSEAAMSEYRKYVEKQIQVEFIKIADRRQLWKKVGNLEAIRLSQQLLDYTGLFSVRVAQSRQALGGTYSWANKQRALALATISELEKRDIQNAKKQLEKKKEELIAQAERVRKLQEDAEDDDPFLAEVGRRGEDEFFGGEEFGY